MARAFRIFAAVIALIGFGWSQAHAQIPLTGAGRGAPGGAATFTGPGDIVSGAKAWWGLRAYSTADRGNRLVNACHSTGAVDDGCADLSSNATTGDLVPAVVDGVHTCPGAGCNVIKFYDRSGALFCGAGVACDIQQPVIADRAALSASCLGAKACLVWSTSTASAYQRPSDDNTALAQPLTFSFVYNLTSSAAAGGVMSCRTGGVFATVDTTPTFNNFAGSNLTAAISIATWFANQSVFNNASSVIFINGSSTSGTTGTNGCGASDALSVGWDQFSHTASAKSMEYGIWGIAFNGTQQANMNSNQRSYWGF